jgi:hypothetical protein
MNTIFYLSFTGKVSNTFYLVAVEKNLFFQSECNKKTNYER